MLNKAKTLNGYRLNSLDGEIGKVQEFYFDDEYWTIRYLVADTGNWLTGQQVLISPYAMVAVIKEQHEITINLTKKQIESSPPLSSHKPVSKQFEMSYFGYYGYPMYWSGSYMWGAYPYIQHTPKLTTELAQEKKSWDSHLRSTHEVSGYNRMQQMMSEVFGLEISEGAIANLLMRVQGQLENILKEVRSARLICSDETSARVNGKNEWEWVFQNDQKAATTRNCAAKALA